MQQLSSKFSPETKRHLMELGPEENPTVAVMLRISDVMTPEREAQITAHGGAVQSVIGDVVTARLPSQSLRALGDLDFVLYIEVARPLYPEPEDEP